MMKYTWSSGYPLWLTIVNFMAFWAARNEGNIAAMRIMDKTIVFRKARWKRNDFWLRGYIMDVFPYINLVFEFAFRLIINRYRGLPDQRPLKVGLNKLINEKLIPGKNQKYKRKKWHEDVTAIKQ